MSKEIQKEFDERVNFKVEEGKNYEVIMKYGIREIVTFAHFQTLFKAVLMAGEENFTSVNRKIVRVGDIRMFVPVDGKTTDQATEDWGVAAASSKDSVELDDLEKECKNFRNDYLDQTYGEDKWTRMLRPKNMAEEKNPKILVTPDELRNSWDRFAEAHPDKAERLQQLLKGEKATGTPEQPSEAIKMPWVD